MTELNTTHAPASDAVFESLRQTAVEMLSPQQLAALTDHLTTEIRGQFEDKITHANDIRLGTERQVQRLLMEASNFQDQVRDALIQFAGERGVDNNELNDMLAELDLDPVETEFEVEIEVQATQRVTVTIMATSAEAAERLVDEGDDDVRRLVEGEISSYDWDIDEYVTKEVTEVR